MGLTIDWTINLGTIIMVVGAFGAGIAAWVTVRLSVSRLSLDLSKLQTDHATQFAAVNAAHKLLAERIEDVRAKGAKELAEFKLEVAKSYAGHEALREMEQRLVKAIDDLGRRMDAPTTRAPRRG